MYDKLNITENHLRVLSLFTNGYDCEYYIREVEKLIKISPRTAQLILESLEDKGLITSKIKGKIKAYTLKRSASCRRYLVFTEQYKAITFFEKNLMINEIIDKTRPFISGVGIIFGSYAKGTETKHSDLDVFVAGKYDVAGIRKVSELYGVDVSVKCYPSKTFEKNIKKDVLLKEILKNHVVFLGSEQFVNAVLMDE